MSKKNKPVQKSKFLQRLQDMRRQKEAEKKVEEKPPENHPRLLTDLEQAQLRIFELQKQNIDSQQTTTAVFDALRVEKLQGASLIEGIINKNKADADEAKAKLEREQQSFLRQPFGGQKAKILKDRKGRLKWAELTPEEQEIERRKELVNAPFDIPDEEDDSEEQEKEPEKPKEEPKPAPKEEPAKVVPIVEKEETKPAEAPKKE